MQKKDRNEFYRRIQSAELDPSNFNLTEKVKKHGPIEAFIYTITYKNTELCFSFFELKTSPGNYKFKASHYYGFISMESEYSSTIHTVYEVQNQFEHWLMNEVREYDNDQIEPDLWQQAYENRLSLEDGQLGEDQNEKFSQFEKDQIRAQLNEFKIQIINEFQLTQDKIELLEERIEYMSETADRVTKRDWQNIAIATLINIGIALSLSADQGHRLMMLFKAAFSGIICLLQ